jgi:two-component system LytT family response regulator
MYRVIIIDDEPLAADLVQEYLNEDSDFEVIDRCLDGFLGLKAIQEKKPDLVFLDVQMPRLTGFEMLELIEDKPAVIFTTAFDEFAFKAFEASALDYLLKPFSEERFEAALKKFKESPKVLKDAVARLPAGESSAHFERLVIKDGARIRIIPYDRLHRIEADGDYVQIYSEQGHFAKKQTLSFYEKLLPSEAFVRVHRSHIVNVSQIDRIDPYGKNDHIALLKDGNRIPISRKGFSFLKDVLGL